jgi:hypothetical protein|tara:strand:- start:44 stop:190 length:147 start_codon:yes stop_codon:yes gene_type:complete
MSKEYKIRECLKKDKEANKEQCCQEMKSQHFSDVFGYYTQCLKCRKTF